VGPDPDGMGRRQSPPRFPMPAQYPRTSLHQANHEPRLRMRVTPYHALPSTEVLVATKQGQVISTVSLIRDGELGPPMESVYGPEVAWYRQRGFSLAEVSCLADCRQGQKRSVPVVMRLMGLMAQCAKRRGVDQLLIAVHPRHVKFYHYFAAFVPIGKERPYHTVCDHPAVAMALDLSWAPIDHPRLYHRFFGTPFPDEVLEYRPLSEELRAELRLVAQAALWISRSPSGILRPSSPLLSGSRPHSTTALS
jgi:hypothetical protein